MQQAQDFLEEVSILFTLLNGLDESLFEHKTLFKNWSINDILVHLHFWNLGAHSALNKPDEFDKMMEHLFQAIQSGKLRPYENSVVLERGRKLLKTWHGLSFKIAEDFTKTDTKKRLKWAGPEMSAKTCISARQMEVWAHGQAIFDLIGKDRPESDRIKNIVFLGVNAFGWSHQVHGLEVPDHMPYLKLNAPSGEVWEFGEPGNINSIEGYAVEFAQVVAQTRNIADTSLKVRGGISNAWMQNAQCFAGPAEKPPQPGLRKKLL